MTVCKQNQAVVSRKFRPVNISLILFRQIFEIKMPIPRIFLSSDTNVIFLSLDCSLFFSRYNTFFEDKPEKG